MLAPALRDGMQRLARPWNRRRAIDVFLDQSSLEASSGLRTSLEAKLGQAEWLVVLLSESAASSRWVNDELEFWLSNRPRERLILVLTSGEILWDGARGCFDERSTAVPQALRTSYNEGADEPLWLDLRWAHDIGSTEDGLDLRNSRFRDAVATVAAPIHGRPKDELEGEDVRQHRRAVRLRRSAIGGLAVLTVTAVVFGFVALAKQREADDQRDVANEQRDIANGQRDIANEQRDIANEQRDIAEAGRLAALAKTVTAEASDLGILLALESLDVVPGNAAGMESLMAATSSPVLTTTLAERDSAVFAVEATADLVVTVDRSGTIEVLGEPEPVSTTGLGTVADSLALSPDQTTLAIPNASATVELHEFAPSGWSGVGPLNHPGATLAMPGAFSPDSSGLAVITDRGVHVWTVDGGEPVFLDVGADDIAWSIAFSRDGERLAAGTANGTVLVWDTGDFDGPDPAPNFVRAVPDVSIAALAFGAQGGDVWFGGERGGLHHWTLESDVLETHEDPTACGSGACLLNEFIYDLDTSDDGSSLVTATGAGARLWSLPIASDDVPTVLPAQGQAIGIAIRERADGFDIIGGGADRTVRKWSLSSPFPVIPDGAPFETVLALDVCVDGSSVVTGSIDGMTRRGNLDGSDWADLPLAEVGSQLAVPGVEAFIASQTAANGITLEPGTSGTAIFDVACDPRSSTIARSVLLTYRGTDAIGTDVLIPIGGRVEVVDPDGGVTPIPAEPWLLEGWSPDLYTVDYLPDGSLVTATTSGGVAALVEAGAFGQEELSEGTVTVWDISPGAAAPTSGPVTSRALLDVAASSSGYSIATASIDGRVRIYDARTLETGPVAEFEPSGSTWVVRVEFANNGHVLAASGETGGVAILDVDRPDADGLSLNGHSGFVRGLAFTDDDRWLVTAGATDGTVRYWDTLTGNQVGTAAELDLGAQDVAVGGDTVIVGTGDGGIIAGFTTADINVVPGATGGLFRLDGPSTSRQRACALAGRDLTDAEIDLYVDDEGDRPGPCPSAAD